MTTQHTHIQHDQDIAAITFAPSDPHGYPWYPVRAWLHRSGLFPLLPPGARGVLDVLDWQAWEQGQQPGRTPGQVIASIEEIAAWCGDSTRTTFRAVGFLLSPPPKIVAITGNPARLLAKLGPTVWEPMPGRGLIRRKGRPDTPVPLVAEPVTRMAQNCHKTSAPQEPQRAHGFGFQSKTEIDQNNNSNSAVVVEILLSAGIGFEQHEAEAIAALPDVDEIRVRNALAGAGRTRKAGKLKVTPECDADRCMRGWVAKAVRERWNLFDQAKADKYAQEMRAKLIPGQIEELKARTRGLWQSDLMRDELTETLQAIGGWEGALAVLPSWKHMSGERIREILLSVAFSRSNA